MSGRNGWTAEHFDKALKKAGKIITCSWGVAAVRDKKTGTSQPVIIFHDDDGGAFAYAFSIDGKEDALALCSDLLAVVDRLSSRQGEGAGNG